MFSFGPDSVSNYRKKGERRDGKAKWDELWRAEIRFEYISYYGLILIV